MAGGGGRKENQKGGVKNKAEKGWGTEGRERKLEERGGKREEEN